MSEKPLSTRQQDILKFTDDYIEDHGRPPTIREIGKEVGITSTSVVNYNLAKLEERGYMDRDPDVSRGLRLTHKAQTITLKSKSAIDRATAQAREVLDSLVRIPMQGVIGASFPVEVFPEEYPDPDNVIELSSTMLPGKTDDLFALRVDGNSMIDAMVSDGDIVVMKPQNEARNGDMVAVWLRGDTTTLKHFYHEGNRIRLQPANPTLQPIYVEPGDVQVQGKVVMVVRNTA